MPFSRQYLQNHMALYGYVPVDIPLIEPASLFLTKAGDQIIEHLFSFEYNGQHYALRPEFTASAANRYIQQENSGVVRWQFSGAIFEDLPQNTGQHWQEFSMGAELIGIGGSSADAEVISMATNGIVSQGLADWKLVIGHVGLTRHLLQAFQLDDRTLRFLLNQRGYLKASVSGKTLVMERLDRYLAAQSRELEIAALDSTNVADLVDLMAGVMPDYGDQQHRAAGTRTREDIARRLIARRQRAAHRDQIVAALEFLVEWAAIEATPDEAFAVMSRYTRNNPAAQQMIDDWRKTLELLVAYELPLDRLVIQPDLARSWDYYTGIVFELQSGSTVFAGGGRYDELTRLIGGQHNIPAVGFACYLDALTRVMGSEIAQFNPIITIAGEDQFVIHLAQQLRQAKVAVAITSERFNADLYAIDTETVELAGQRYPIDPIEPLLQALENTHV